jgi:hypothetical protein
MKIMGLLLVASVTTGFLVMLADPIDPLVKAKMNKEIKVEEEKPSGETLYCTLCESYVYVC